ncbi:MAG: hypothetical protein O7J95_02750 [Planctomycetota bacterium]|nr:hypothetical protein [Planctomycetota bacterium]
MDLGPGQMTDVAIHRRLFAVVTMKDSDKPNVNPGRLVAVAGNLVVNSIEVGPGPDHVEISRSGKFAVIACEGSTPEDDPTDGEFCPTELLPALLEELGDFNGDGEVNDADLEDALAGVAADDGEAIAALEDAAGDAAKAVDQAGSIDIVDLRRGPRRMEVVARVTAGDMFDLMVSRAEEAGEDAKTIKSRAKKAKNVEPEFVALGPDSDFALVTLQEQSAVAVVDLEAIEDLLDDDDDSLTPEEIGAAALVDVVLLPHGVKDSKGKRRGTHPDGIDISPDGDFAITANESKKTIQHLQGISILDLSEGLENIEVVATYCIFDLDPTLLDGTDLTECPPLGDFPEVPDPDDPGATIPGPAVKGLPRLDPEDIAILEVDDTLVAAVAIERKAKDEDRGSVLFLDVTDALDGAFPEKIDRKLVGFNKKAAPEIVTPVRSKGRDFVFVSIEKDDGTIARIPVDEDDGDD